MKVETEEKKDIVNETVSSFFGAKDIFLLKNSTMDIDLFRLFGIELQVKKENSC